MRCDSCNNEFSNINGLKFCPYCGEQIDGKIEMQGETILNNEDGENKAKPTLNEKKEQDTSAMPVISDKDIRKYKRDKIFAWVKKTFIHKKVIIPMIAIISVIIVSVFAYSFFIVRPIDDARIKEDLIGTIVTLPKGTVIKINKDNMKSFIISNRNTQKSKDEIKLALTLNNDALEAKVLLSVVYLKEGKNEWKTNGKPVTLNITSVKPVVGINDKIFLAKLKGLKMTIGNTQEALNGQNVKNLGITLRTPDFQNGKEEILVETTIDSGLLRATGKIKCSLVFEDETWSVNSIDANSSDDFKLTLSPNFSDEKAIQIIKKQGLAETVSYSDFFGGKGFSVKDGFTKNINISGKTFNEKKGTLNLIAKRENIAGEIKSVLSTNYTFSISLSDIALLNGSETTVDSAVISNIPESIIIPSITNGEIEGSNLLFWWSNNHKVTEEEAKTFKTDKTLSTKGLKNIKYVYGNITYKDDKNNKSKDRSVSIVAVYFLVYDDSSGYNWKLNKLISEDSPNYKTYINLKDGL
ncbi:hypothetical protein [Clostridium estertheticum]|uniref:hypothetical protein n=1 Tax=Clostridium estertheticum TaxID=238834 RepID=UPI001C7D58AC|nr:hypothetical protein [Clostridium estertheticum]MBX4263402.1 hypothetical protein [Clostridium estertheticum]MBX4270842.1 hypothetical protein [Clostridium estertheticum]WLC78668.1 hypothetical protein KTC98_15850 [Clostridium estertheticum]WLC89689.1 hypothetical protein KTC95_05640 [Clostridium estertheticum]